MSERLTSATKRQKKSSNPTASPSNSGKNEIRVFCSTLLTIYLSGISEAGKSIAEHSERTPAASIAGSTASVLGLVKCGGHGQLMPSDNYRVGFRRGTRCGLWLFCSVLFAILLDGIAAS